MWLHAEPHMWERRGVGNPRVNGDRRRQSVNVPNAVKVSVADTGPGIRPEYHLEIFDDFFRLPGSESAEGMGLGLAIARRLLQGMGGKIWVESEPGAGCKFSFLIPLKPILSSPPRGTQMSETANILLVDDEPGMLRYIRTLLEVDEHKVQTASTGEEAVEQVQKGLRPTWSCSIC